ncbi:DNRLRE domain-containing protein [Mesobacillus stamsii]|nr:DNRLRE domain-containing protein [Mesobacillus stamsii]MDQ0414363.1 RHS repeat-associated protein [Mesobacillus stamsii]
MKMKKTTLWKKSVINLMCLTLLIAYLPLGNFTEGIVEANADVDSAESISKSKVREEIVSKRTANSKTFLNTDGTYTAEISQIPIHYKNSRNTWSEIESNLIENTTEENYQNKANSFKAKLDKKVDKDTPLLQVEDQDRSIKMELAPVENTGKEPAEVTGVVEDNSIQYPEIYQNISLTYTIGADRIKEDIIFNERTSSGFPDKFTYKLDLVGLNAKEVEGVLYLYDQDTNQPIYYFETPYMYDSYKPEGFQTAKEITSIPEEAISYDVTLEHEVIDGQLYLYLIPSKAWLEDSERIYPITIDPTIVKLQSSNYVKDTNLRSTFPTQTGGNDLELGGGASNGNVLRSLIKFDLSSIPGATHILSSSLNLWFSSTNGSSPVDISLFKVSRDWEENQASWNYAMTSPSVLWTNKGGDYVVSNKLATVNGFTSPTSLDLDMKKWEVPIHIIQNWKDSTDPNYGFLLKSDSESTNIYKKFVSSEHTFDSKYHPLLAVTYRTNARLGMEDHWSYAEHTLSDGQGYTNLGTGNLMLQFTDFEVSGRGNSGFVFNRTYNSKSNEDSAVGFGWSFSGSETVTELPNRDLLYTDADGTAHTFTYNSTTSSYITPVGLYLSIKRAASNAFEIKDFNGNRMIFRDLINDPEVNARKFLIEYEEDRNLNRVTYQRQTDGTLSSITDASGRKLTFTYENGRIVSTSFEGTPKTAYTYENGKLKTLTMYKEGSEGAVTQFTYNSDGKVSTLLDANNQPTHYTYLNGFLTNVHQPTIADTNLSKTTYSYDITNYTATETDAKGNKTEYLLDNNYVILETIDPLGNITSTEYDANYNPTIQTDAIGNQTVNSYDSKGNLLTTKNPLGNTVDYTYNEFSQPLTITDSKGKTTNIYNSVGDQIEVISPIGEKTINEYDSYGNLVSTTFADGTKETYAYDTNKNYQKSVTDSLGRTTTTLQDKYGNTTSVTDSELNTIYYTYNLQNLLTQVKDAKGNITSYEYDANGNLNTATNAALKKTLFTYNAQNQLTTRKEPLGQTTSFVYDANGNTIETGLPSGDKLHNFYNQNNQLLHKVINDSRKWTYSYDANGNVESVLNVVTGAKKVLTYNKNNKVTKSSSDSQSVEYGYDGTGVATSVVGKSGTQSFTQSYTIDANERLTHIKRNGASQVSLTYTKKDSLAFISYVNGISSTYDYDVAGQLNTLTVKKGTTALDTFTYTYDTRGNIISVTSNAGIATYDYDENNQLISETTVDGATISYEYDKVGNQTKKNLVENEQTTINSYSYNDNNQLTQFDGQSYSYDPNGNRTQDSQYKYIYNKLGELVEIQTLNGQTIATYAYNEDSRRTSKTVNGQTTYYHYDEEQVLFETDESGTITAEYSYDDFGRPLTMTKEGETYYYILNEHKDVIALTDALGNTVALYAYDAWGNILAKSGSMADKNPYRYASYRHDNESGLYYLLARYYEPNEGLFLFIDPNREKRTILLANIHMYMYKIIQ